MHPPPPAVVSTAAAQPARMHRTNSRRASGPPTQGKFEVPNNLRQAYAVTEADAEVRFLALQQGIDIGDHGLLSASRFDVWGDRAAELVPVSVPRKATDLLQAPLLIDHYKRAGRLQKTELDLFDRPHTRLRSKLALTFLCSARNSASALGTGTTLDCQVGSDCSTVFVDPALTARPP